jgi:hypothetical protein
MGTLVWGMRARGKQALGMMARGKWAWGIVALGTLEKRQRRPVQRELKPVIQVEQKSKMNIARSKPFFKILFWDVFRCKRFFTFMLLLWNLEQNCAF